MSEHSLLTSLTAEIVASFLVNNEVDKANIGDVIASTFSALKAASTEPVATASAQTPRVAIKRTVTPDYIISLEDGGRYKSLKRHLAGRGLTPEAYREKWGLAGDYPMVAPTYSKRRSELAKSYGFGKIGKPATSAQASKGSAASTKPPKKSQKPKPTESAEVAT